MFNPLNRLCFAILLASLPCTGAAEQDAVIPRDFSLQLTRGTCEGACPTYSVSVDNQGSVLWNGDRFVHRKGIATKVIANSQLNSMIRRTRELRVLSLQPGNYPCLDAPLVKIELTLGGRSISVAYCVGDVSPEGKRVVEFAEIVDRMLGTEAWVGGIEDRRMN